VVPLFFSDGSYGGGRCNFVSSLLSFASMTLQASTYRSSSARVIQVRAPSFCGLIVPSQIRL